MAVKKKMNQVLKTAKDSIKLLGALEKETRAKAKEYVKFPEGFESATNEKILQGLEKMGLATQKQLSALESRIEALERKLAGN